MTQQVRTGYRKHRKAAWGLALLVAVAIAAVTIPLASGAPTQTLRFVTQPASVLESSTGQSTTIAVAVFSGGPNPVNSNPPPMPILSATGAGGIGNFVVTAGPTYSSTTKTWSWTVKPTSTATSGTYNFVATLGTLTATSSPVRVVQFVCPAGGGPSCNGTSNFGNAGQGKLNIANTLATPILLDFSAGGATAPLGCNNDLNDPTHTWNRAYYFAADGVTPIYFPAVTLDFTWGTTMLQVTYMVRNSQWTLTAATRGNQDIDFCAVARHQTAALNDGQHPFAGKYGNAAWDGANYSGVLAAVSNPTKVNTDGTGSPAVCGRGSQDISGETWRTWTICIPYDWDWGVKPG
jgi:hypothetical protein